MGTLGGVISIPSRWLPLLRSGQPPLDRFPIPRLQPDGLLVIPNPVDDDLVWFFGYPPIGEIVSLLGVGVVVKHFIVEHRCGVVVLHEIRLADVPETDTAVVAAAVETVLRDDHCASGVGVVL